MGDSWEGQGQGILIGMSGGLTICREGSNAECERPALRLHFAIVAPHDKKQLSEKVFVQKDPTPWRSKCKEGAIKQGKEICFKNSSDQTDWIMKEPGFQCDYLNLDKNLDEK